MSIPNSRAIVIAAYSALACISLVLGHFMHSAVLTGRLLAVTAIICTLLGPCAWLIHGIAGVPLFLAATFLIVMGGMLALLFVGRFSHPLAVWVGAAFTACIWLATGWVAWTFTLLVS